jgi:hypothetical protein
MVIYAANVQQIFSLTGVWLKRTLILIHHHRVPSIGRATSSTTAPAARFPTASSQLSLSGPKYPTLHVTCSKIQSIKSALITGAVNITQNRKQKAANAQSITRKDIHCHVIVCGRQQKKNRTKHSRIITPLTKESRSQFAFIYLLPITHTPTKNRTRVCRVSWSH